MVRGELMAAVSEALACSAELTSGKATLHDIHAEELWERIEGMSDEEINGGSRDGPAVAEDHTDNDERESAATTSDESLNGDSGRRDQGGQSTGSDQQSSETQRS
jgi:hypothetical protein